MKLFFVLFVTVVCNVGVLAQEFTWQTLHKQTSKTFKGLYVLDEKHIWAYTNECSVIVTSDGGATWNEYSVDTSCRVGTALFLDANNGFVTGDRGFMRKTSDGGKTWTRKDYNTKQYINHLQFITPQLGFMGINQQRFGSKVYGIFKTTDGGVTWANVTPVEFFACQGMDFMNAETGIIIQDRTPYKTTDGGVTWKAYQDVSNSSVYNYAKMFSISHYVFCSYSKFYVTKNDGKSYTSWDPSTVNDTISACNFADEKNGCIALYHTGFVTTTDGGTTWSKLTGLPDEKYEFSIIDNQHIIAYTDKDHIYIAANNAIVKGVRKTTSVEGETEQLQSISPNPANTTLSITFPVGTTGIWILTDYLGNKIHAEEYNSNVQPQTVFNSTTLANGFYTVRFVTNTSVVSQHVIVQH